MDDGQTYSRRSLLVYLAIMEGASTMEAVASVEKLMSDPDEHVRLRQEITWAQFIEETPKLKELLCE